MSLSPNSYFKHEASCEKVGVETLSNDFVKHLHIPIAIALIDIIQARIV